MATDYYQARLQGLHQTEYNECVLYFKGTNLTIADYMPNAQDLVDAIINTFLAEWLAMFPASYELLRITTSKASPGGGGAYTHMFQIGTQTGSVLGAAASQQLCPVVRLIPPMGIKTAGKIYLPCIAESQIQANVVNSTWLTNLTALMSLMLGPFSSSGADWNLQVYSRKNGVFSNALSYDTSPVVGFQRRRARAQL